MTISKSEALLKSRKSKPRIRPSMRKEFIHPSDCNTYNLPYSCEECVHFRIENTSCTLGLNAQNHLAETQRKSYELSGHMALCRFQEID